MEGVALSTANLRKILDADSRLKHSNIQICAFDRIPYMKANSAVIVNNQDHTQGGQHWLSLYKREDGIYEFWDSFGLPPSAYDLIKKHAFLRRAKIIYHTKSIQSILSNFCGLYAIYYLKKRYRGYDMNQIVSMFGENVEINDSIIVKKFAEFKF